jgi:hypothetical protein
MERGRHLEAVATYPFALRAPEIVPFEKRASNPFLLSFGLSAGRSFGGHRAG